MYIVLSVLFSLFRYITFYINITLHNIILYKYNYLGERGTYLKSLWHLRLRSCWISSVSVVQAKVGVFTGLPCPFLLLPAGVRH